MSILGSYRLFNRLDNGSLTGAQLDTLLAGSRELAEFKQLCDTPQAASALAASPTAVAAIAGSAIATQVVLDNRRNFDVLARQRLSDGSVTFLEEFFFSELVSTGINNTSGTGCVLYNGGKFFVSTGTAVHITDGLGKSIHVSSIITLRSMIFANGLYVGVAYNNTNVAYSYDGNTWFTSNIGSSLAWRDVAFGNGVFVAIAENPGLSTSTNGITWTLRTAPSGGWFSVTFANGQFVAVGSSVAATSTDGITWTLRTIPTGQWFSVTYANGLYVAVGSVSSAGAIVTSPDGITWTSRTTPAGVTQSTLTSVTFGGGNFIAVGNGNAANCTVSKDGLTWFARRFSSQTGDFSRAISYGDGVFIASSNLTTSPAQIIRSISSVFP
jgi:hypothetical protein